MDRNWIALALVAIVFFTAGFFSTGFVEQPIVLDSVKPVFSPGSQDALVALIESSDSNLDIVLYQFSNNALKSALVEAAGRGVRVRLILEPRVDSNLATATFLNGRGVEVRWATRQYSNTHSKTLVADGRRVLVGSINWSNNAVKTNRESAVVVESEELAREFEEVFEEDWVKASEVKA